MIGTIETRSQKSVGRAKGFGGPDRYMVVVWRDEQSEPVGMHPLSESNIRKYAWEVEWIGEYYSRSTGPRSRYAENRRHAEQRLAEGYNPK